MVDDRRRPVPCDSRNCVFRTNDVGERYTCKCLDSLDTRPKQRRDIISYVRWYQRRIASLEARCNELSQMDLFEEFADGIGDIEEF